MLYLVMKNLHFRGQIQKAMNHDILIKYYTRALPIIDGSLIQDRVLPMMDTSSTADSCEPSHD